MKINKCVTIFRILLILITVSLIFNNFCMVFAEYKIKDTFNGKIDSEAAKAKTTVQDTLLTVLTAVRIAGIGIALIIIVIIGIKIMIAAPEEKANIKQYSINYLIGAIILVGASGIMGIVKKIALSAFEN